MMSPRFSFNSKLVRLKDEGILTEKRGSVSFNSKLVRLKVKGGAATIVVSDTFQFQTGAIKSEFNPKTTDIIVPVSIPNWCD